VEWNGLTTYARHNKACVFLLSCLLKLGLLPEIPTQLDWNLKTQNTPILCIENSSKPWNLNTQNPKKKCKYTRAKKKIYIYVYTHGHGLRQIGEGARLEAVECSPIHLGRIHRGRGVCILWCLSTPEESLKESFSLSPRNFELISAANARIHYSPLCIHYSPLCTLLSSAVHTTLLSSAVNRENAAEERVFSRFTAESENTLLQTRLSSASLDSQRSLDPQQSENTLLSSAEERVFSQFTAEESIYMRSTVEESIHMGKALCILSILLCAVNPLCVYCAFSITHSSANSTPPKSASSNNSNSSVHIQSNPKSWFEFVREIGGHWCCSSRGFWGWCSVFSGKCSSGFANRHTVEVSYECTIRGM